MLFRSDECRGAEIVSPEIVSPIVSPKTAGAVSGVTARGQRFLGSGLVSVLAVAAAGRTLAQGSLAEASEDT